jgi:hypothetical protein
MNFGASRDLAQPSHVDELRLTLEESLGRDWGVDLEFGDTTIRL